MISLVQVTELKVERGEIRFHLPTTIYRPPSTRYIPPNDRSSAATDVDSINYTLIAWTFSFQQHEECFSFVVFYC